MTNIYVYTIMQLNNNKLKPIYNHHMFDGWIYARGSFYYNQHTHRLCVHCCIGWLFLQPDVLRHTLCSLNGTIQTNQKGTYAPLITLICQNYTPPISIKMS